MADSVMDLSAQVEGRMATDLPPVVMYPASASSGLTTLLSSRSASPASPTVGRVSSPDTATPSSPATDTPVTLPNATGSLMRARYTKVASFSCSKLKKASRRNSRELPPNLLSKIVSYRLTDEFLATFDSDDFCDPTYQTSLLALGTASPVFISLVIQKLQEHQKIVRKRRDQVYEARKTQSETCLEQDLWSKTPCDQCKRAKENYDVEEAFKASLRKVMLRLKDTEGRQNKERREQRNEEKEAKKAKKARTGKKVEKGAIVSKCRKGIWISNLA